MKFLNGFLAHHNVGPKHITEIFLENLQTIVEINKQKRDLSLVTCQLAKYVMFEECNQFFFHTCMFVDQC